MAPILEIPRPIPTGPGGYPRILALAAERFAEFYDRPEKLPELAVGPGGDETRSERREGVIRTGTALLKCCDLRTLEVGTVVEGAFVNIHFQTVAAHADLERRRMERAVRDLKEGGYLTVVQKRKHNPDGTIRSVPALKRLSQKFFRVLGLSIQLEQERKKARARSPLKESAPPERPEMRDAVKNLQRQMLEAQRRRLAPPKPPPEDETERGRRRAELLWKLRQAHPDWSAEQVRRAADAQMA